MMMASQPHVVLHCNAGSEYGMGHLMRCLTLGVEADRQGWRVTLVGDLDHRSSQMIGTLAPSADVITTHRGTSRVPLADCLPPVKPTWIHIDSYWPDADTLAELGVPTSNMQDGEFGTRPATLAIDANLDSEGCFFLPELSPHHLAGSTAAVVRDQVLQQRDRDKPENDQSKILVVLGGTDPFGITPQVVEALEFARSKWQVTVVAPARVHDLVIGKAASSKHEINVVGFVDDLPALAQLHDAVITAAGTSVWDFACMGVPMGLICVTENQLPGFRAAVREGLGIAISEPDHSGLSDGLLRFEETVSSATQLHDLAVRGKSIVDGMGAWRIVSAWESLKNSSAYSHTLLTSLVGQIVQPEQTRPGDRDSIAQNNVRVRILDGRHVVGEVTWARVSRTDWIGTAELRSDIELGAALLASEVAFEDALPARALISHDSEKTAISSALASAGYLPFLPRTAGHAGMVAKLLVTSAKTAP